MHNLEEATDLASIARLKGADVMIDGHLFRCKTCCVHGRDFVACLCESVFSKVAMPCAKKLRNFFGGMSLADGDHSNFWVPQLFEPRFQSFKILKGHCE